MDKSDTFYNVEISATLKLKTPMLIGEGDNGLDNRLVACKTNKGAAYLPGSSIKGSLFSIASDPEVSVWVFGRKPKEKSDDDLGKGGSVRFLDALAVSPVNTVTNVRNSIERTTGTAKDSHLFELEMVSENTEFEVKLQIDKANRERLDQIKSLLTAWGAAENSLGRGANQSYGEFLVLDISIQGVAEEEQQNWLMTLLSGDSKPDQQPAQTKIDNIDGNKLNNWDTSGGLQINIDLIPLGPVFVGNEKPEKKKSDENTVLKPRRNKDGYVVLPSTSFRGVMRSQAEKIIATLLDLEACEQPPVEGLFGSTDLKSRLRISDFIAEKAGKSTEQTMLAIDRFTGAIKSGATYNVERVDTGKLKGKITLDWNLLKPELHAELALLFMLIRDLFDAELIFGAYKAKGFGKVTAVARFKGSEKVLSNWSEFYQAWEERSLINGIEVPSMDTLEKSFTAKFVSEKEKADV